jgi:putative ABC transport system substrate-binding protein
MRTRRDLLLLTVVVAASIPIAAWTQQPVRLQRVGVLSPGQRGDMVCRPNNQGSGIGCFVEALRALGHSEGRNVAFEYRFAEGAAERLAGLAAELVSLKPDVIYTFTTAGANAAAKATTTIPIVVGPAGERTLERLAGSLARPIGNVTGLTVNSYEQDEKCLQLLKELAPRTSRVAMLVNPDNPNYGSYLDLLRPAATRQGITLSRIDARNAAGLPQAFAAIQASGADAVLIADDSALVGTTELRQQIAAWAVERRLPVASSNSRVAADGGLVSMGTESSALVRRAAYYVHRILGGAKPADLPVERPTTFKLSLNRTTAATLGLTIPPALLLRADEVIP